MPACFLAGRGESGGCHPHVTIAAPLRCFWARGSALEVAWSGCSILLLAFWCAPKFVQLANKLVTGAVHGQDVFRFFWNGFQLLPQADDVCVHGARCGEMIVSPHLLQQAV